MLTLKSYPKETPSTRRSRLILATRRAWKHWERSCYDLADKRCALSCDSAAVHAAHTIATHRLRRYNKLESALADETDLPKDTVYNEIAQWTPNSTRLLYGAVSVVGEAA